MRGFKEKFSEEVCIYLLYPDQVNPESVYYLDKRKPKKPNHPMNGKLIGFGGVLESGEDIYEGSKRELDEELGEFGLDAKIERMVYQGKVIREDFERVIHMLKYPLDVLLENGAEIDNEGIGRILPVKFHWEYDNSRLFPAQDYAFLDKLYFTDDFFEINVDKNGKIKS